METSKSLRKPLNWQDFETLCKKLWGEIWNCQEIKKNGRNGQAQHGVDIYGIPFGEICYYGIQCKGKDDYTDKKITEDEILEEIEKAKLFIPQLKKLYFASTSQKDVKIEEFVRKKNLESVLNGLFEIHIFLWEDIVELIDENKHTHDWYLLNQNFKVNKSVFVTFEDDSFEYKLRPQFKKITRICAVKKPITPLWRHENSMIDLRNINAQSHFYETSLLGTTKINLAYCDFKIKIHNNGVEPIEDFKLMFSLEGDFEDLCKTNEEYTGIALIRPKNPQIPILKVDKVNKCGVIEPFQTILVGDDVFLTNKIFIKPLAFNNNILLRWKIISKDFKSQGELLLQIDPIFEKEYCEVIVNDESQVKVIRDEIVDLIITKKNT